MREVKEMATAGKFDIEIDDIPERPRWTVWAGRGHGDRDFTELKAAQRYARSYEYAQVVENIGRECFVRYVMERSRLISI